MADLYRRDDYNRSGYGLAVKYGRRSLINPGNKVTPTGYYHYIYRSSENPGSMIQNNWNSYYQKWDISVSPYWWSQFGSGVLGPSQFPTTVTLGPVGLGYSDARNRAISKLCQKALDAKSSDFNAGVFVAEAGKSVSMITNAATRIYAAQRALRRGRLGDVYKSLGIKPPKKPVRFDQNGKPIPIAGKRKYPPAVDVRTNAANYWLEAKYGWLPLLSDAKSAAEKLATIVQGKPEVLRLRARTSVTAAPIVSKGFSGSASWVTTLLEKQRVEMVVNYTVSSRAVSMASSLGLTNPALIAWETVPLSFVLDWFLPIGNFLEELGAFHGFSFVSGYQSTLLETEYSFYGSGYRYNYSSTRYDVVTSGSYWWKKFGWTRGALTGFPVPSFPRLRVTEIPGLFQKIITSAALIRQRSL